MCATVLDVACHTRERASVSAMRENTSTRINVPKCNLLPTPFLPPTTAAVASLCHRRAQILSLKILRAAVAAESVYTYEPVSRATGPEHTFYTLALSLSLVIFSSIQILKYPSRAIQSYVLCCICRAAERFYNVYFYYYTLGRLKCAAGWRAPLLFLQIYDWWWTVALQLLVIDTQFIIISSAAISALERCFF